MSQEGNSNRITRNYLDSLLIETRYMNSDILVWASLYNSKGEDRFVSPSLDEYYSNAYRTDAPIEHGGYAHPALTP